MEQDHLTQNFNVTYAEEALSGSLTSQRTPL